MEEAVLRMTRWVAGLVLLLAALVCNAGGARGAPSASKTLTWPAPSNPLALARKAGLVPERHETLQHHVHAHLDVFVNGRHLQVPAGIGINIYDPGVKHGHFYGGPVYGSIKECRQPCISPLHTHAVTGILHTESASPVPHRLGQFFIEWGVRLTPQCVNRYCMPKTKIAIYVNGSRYHGDPRQIQLLNHREIAIVIGKPPRFIPPTADFSTI